MSVKAGSSTFPVEIPEMTTARDHDSTEALAETDRCEIDGDLVLPVGYGTSVWAATPGGTTVRMTDEVQGVIWGADVGSAVRALVFDQVLVDPESGEPDEVEVNALIEPEPSVWRFVGLSSEGEVLRTTDLPSTPDGILLLGPAAVAVPYTRW